MPPDTEQLWRRQRSSSRRVRRPLLQHPERWRLASHWRCSTFSGSIWWWCEIYGICLPPRRVASPLHRLLTWMHKGKTSAESTLKNSAEINGFIIKYWWNSKYPPLRKYSVTKMFISVVMQQQHERSLLHDKETLSFCSRVTSASKMRRSEININHVS